MPLVFVCSNQQWILHSLNTIQSVTKSSKSYPVCVIQQCPNRNDIIITQLKLMIFVVLFRVTPKRCPRKLDMWQWFYFLYVVCVTFSQTLAVIRYAAFFWNENEKAFRAYRLHRTLSQWRRKCNLRSSNENIQCV